MTRTELKDLITSTIQDDSPNSAAEIRNILGLIIDGFSNTVEIREVPTSYIAANFDPTGLGINLEVGFAICNGNNGTRDFRGRVPMQYSDSYPTLGSVLGSPNTVVVSHSHGLSQVKKYNNSQGTNGFYDRSTGAPGSGLFTDTVGESGTDKNYQPSIITLFLKKL